MAKISELMDQGETVTVEHRGATYTLDRFDPEDPPLDVMEALEDKGPVAACKILLGSNQWLEFKKTKPRLSDLNAILSAAFGTDLGKSAS